MRWSRRGANILFYIKNAWLFNDWTNNNTLIFAAIGFVIGTLKVPESSATDITRKTGGENIDDVIVRWIKFKKNGNKIYVYKPEEETKDGK